MPLTSHNCCKTEVSGYLVMNMYLVVSFCVQSRKPSKSDTYDNSKGTLCRNGSADFDEVDFIGEFWLCFLWISLNFVFLQWVIVS